MQRVFAALVLTCATLLSTTTRAQLVDPLEPVEPTSAADAQTSVPITRSGDVLGPRPAIIAEEGAPMLFSEKRQTKYYVVNDNVAYPIDSIEAVALSGDSDTAWRMQVAPLAVGAVMAPFATVGILMMSFGLAGATSIGVVAAASLAPITPMQAALGVGGGVVAGLVGTGVLAAGVWLSMWLGDVIGPTPKTLSSLNNVQYVDGGTLPAVLAERHCVLGEAE